MRVAIYQPQYFPRLHYFNRALASDRFVLLTSAQYTRRLVHEERGRRVAQPSFQSQTPIKSPTGALLLRVPISGSRRRPISRTEVSSGEDWAATQLRTVELCYRRAPYFDRYFPELISLLSGSVESLGDLDVRTFLWGVTRLIGVDVPVSRLSIASVNDALAGAGEPLRRVVPDGELASRPEGQQQGTAWTVALCRALAATEYLHGATARTNYMDLDAYRRAGIEPIEQSWTADEYRQLHTSTAGFIPNLSIVDLLFNVAPNEGLDIVMGRATSAPAFHDATLPSPGLDRHAQRVPRFQAIDKEFT